MIKRTSRLFGHRFVDPLEFLGTLGGDFSAITGINVRVAFFSVGDGWGFYGMGQLCVLLCMAGVALAAFSLVMDFEAIQQAIVYGAPRKEAWRGAFGLMVTLVWLYLELLRLLAILQGRD